MLLPHICVLKIGFWKMKSIKLGLLHLLQLLLKFQLQRSYRGNWKKTQPTLLWVKYHRIESQNHWNGWKRCFKMIKSTRKPYTAKSDYTIILDIDIKLLNIN